MAVRLHDKLRSIRDEESMDKILNQVQNWLRNDQDKYHSIQQRIQEKPSPTNTEFNLPEAYIDRLYTIDDIKKLCVNYRLRFLDSYQYKGTIPQHAIQQIKALESNLGTTFSNLKIIAPSSHFLLEDCNSDPILLAKINDHLYLFIDRWGNDMSWIRSILAWPLKTIKNAFITLMVISGITTLLVPDSFLLKNEALPIWHYKVLFFVYLLMVMSIMTTFFGFMFYKNFSVVNWNNKYFNA